MVLELRLALNIANTYVYKPRRYIYIYIYARFDVYADSRMELMITYTSVRIK